MRKRQARKNRRNEAVRKLKQALLYLASKGEIWGSTEEEAWLRAECLLFFIDMECFRVLGHPLTGGRWRKGRDHFEWMLPE